MTNESRMSPDELAAIDRAISSIESEMCCIEHPLYHVLCLRNIGHNGPHWFMTRWQDSRDAIAQAGEALRIAMTGEQS